MLLEGNAFRSQALTVLNTRVHGDKHKGGNEFVSYWDGSAV